MSFRTNIIIILYSVIVAVTANNTMADTPAQTNDLILRHVVIGVIADKKTVNWRDRAVPTEPSETEEMKDENDQTYYRLKVPASLRLKTYDMLLLRDCDVYKLTDENVAQKIDSQKVIVLTPFMSGVKPDNIRYLFHAQEVQPSDTFIQANNLSGFLILKQLKSVESRIREKSWRFNQELVKYGITLSPDEE